MTSRPHAAVPDHDDVAASAPQGTERSGDAHTPDQAFDTLFRATYPGLVRLAYRFVGARDTAEEIVQEVFLSLWRRRDELDPQSLAHAYLYTSTRHAAVSWLRRARLERNAQCRDDVIGGATHGSPGANAAEALELSELNLAIERAIEGLPKRCRLVFTLSRREHLSYAAIAAALGLSVKTVEAQMARAFRHIRTSVSPYLGALVLTVLSAGVIKTG